MARAATPRRAVQHEKVEQAHIQQLAETLGAKVYVLGTRRSRGRACSNCGTFVAEDQGLRQTPGHPDLEIYLKAAPRSGQPAVTRVLLFWETKHGRNGMTPDQADYRELALAANVAHGVGDYNAFIAWLIERGYVSAASFPYYRQPQRTS